MDRATADALLGDPNFQGQVRAAAVARALTLPGQSLATRLLQDPNAAVTLLSYPVLVNLDVATGVTPSDSDVAAAVAAVWANVAGEAPTVTLALSEQLANLAASPSFQARVVQVIAGLVTQTLAAPAKASDDPGKQADILLRGFAMRFQAGLYLTPAFRQNFAINVLSPITTQDALNALDDAAIAATCENLIGLMVAGRLELDGEGKTLSNVLGD